MIYSTMIHKQTYTYLNNLYIDYYFINTNDKAINIYNNLSKQYSNVSIDILDTINDTVNMYVITCNN